MDQCREHAASKRLLAKKGEHQNRLFFPFGHFSVLSNITTENLTSHLAGNLTSVFSTDKNVTRDVLIEWADYLPKPLLINPVKRYWAEKTWVHLVRMSAWYFNMKPFESLLAEIQNCTICESSLADGVHPVLQVHPQARVLIAGQAPKLQSYKLKRRDKFSNNPDPIFSSAIFFTKVSRFFWTDNLIL